VDYISTILGLEQSDEFLEFIQLSDETDVNELAEQFINQADIEEEQYKIIALQQHLDTDYQDAASQLDSY